MVRQLFERRVLEAEPRERERWFVGAAGRAAEVLTAAPMPAAAEPAGPAAPDPGYAWAHGLYWLASNISVESPLLLMVDDLQWCDAPSARALAFIARRLEGLPLGSAARDAAARSGVDTRSGDARDRPGYRAAATVAADAGRDRSPDLQAPVGEPDQRFVRACIEVTGGNPFLLGELLDEAADRGLDPTAAAAADVAAIVPRGVANTVLLRLARMDAAVAALARSLSVLGDGAQVGDAAGLAALGGAELEMAMSSLVSAGVMESGGTIRFTHPILRAAIYGDLSAAERERLHCAASKLLEARGAPPDSSPHM